MIKLSKCETITDEKLFLETTTLRAEGDPKIRGTILARQRLALYHKVKSKQIEAIPEEIIQSLNLFIEH